MMEESTPCAANTTVKGIVTPETMMPVAMLEKTLVIIAVAKTMIRMNSGRGMPENRGVNTSASQVLTPRSLLLSAPPIIMKTPMVAMKPQFAPATKCFLQSIKGSPSIFAIDRITITRTNHRA